ncbi:serine hydrolase domain-containing protein [Sorangium sp. So ce861]|uniref:serine hydrolase domain-containing protein n=1 Tax=Sorangium sp. So ce861 TaxID=3133323 RepID=UPI003F614FC2
MDRELTRRMAERADEGNLPFVTLCTVGRDGALRSFVHARSAEVLGPGGGEPLCRMGSLTKLVTAAALLRLVESGRLSLDASLGEVLPEAAPGELAGTLGAATLRQLLGHAAGLPRGGYHAPPEGEPPAEPCAPLFSPGQAFKYSNLGYALAGRAIAAAAGDTYAAHAERAVLAPLGMRSSTLRAPRRAGAPQGMQRAHYRSLVRRDDALEPAPPIVLPTAAGGLISTASDYARLVAALFTPQVLKGAPLLRPASVAALLSPARRAAPGLSFGLGVGQATFQGLPCLFHVGCAPGFTSYFACLPALGLTAVATAGRAGATNELKTLVHFALGRLASDEPPPSPPSPAPSGAHLGGAYFSGARRLEIRERGGRLVAIHDGGPERLLTHHEGASFIQQGGPFAEHLLRFELSEGRAVACHAGPRSFSRDRARRPRPPDRTWGPLLGAYRHPLTGEAEVFACDGRLVFAFGPTDRALLRPLGPATFELQDGSFHRERATFAELRDGCFWTLRIGDMDFVRGGDP